MPNLVSPTNRLAWIEDADVQQAFDAGYRPPTPAELDSFSRSGALGATIAGLGSAAIGSFGGLPPTSEQLARTRREEGGWSAAAEGVVPALAAVTMGPTAPFIQSTVGLAQELAPETSAELRQELQAYREANPVAAVVGGAAPVVAAGFATGGAAAGLGVGRAALIGAATGAAQAGGQEVTEAVLKNQALAGEQLAASMGIGAALGGIGEGAGVGFAKLALRAGRPTGRALAAARDVLVGEDTPAVRALQGALLPIQRVVTGESEGVLRAVGGIAKSSRQGIADAQNIGDLIATTSDDFARQVGDLERAKGELIKELGADTKLQHITAKIPHGRQAEQFQEAMTQLQAIEARLVAAAEEASRPEGSLTAWGRELRDASAQVRYRINELSARSRVPQKPGALAAADADANKLYTDDAGALAYSALDESKRAIGPYATRFVNQAQRTGTAKEVASANGIREVFNSLRSNLENAALWGDDMALAQRAINAPLSASLGMEAPFYKAFMTAFNEEDFARVYRADSGKIQNHFKTMAGPKAAGNLNHEALRRMLDSDEAFAKAIQDHFVLSQAQKANVERIAAANKRLRELSDVASDRIANANMHRDAAIRESRGDIISGVVGGGLIGGPLGALAGAAVDVVRHPVATGRRLVQIARLYGEAQQHLGGKVDKVFAGSATVTAKVARVGTAARRGLPAAVVAAQRLQGEYEKSAKSVRAANAATLQETLRPTSAIQGAAPKTVASIHATGQRAQAFLQSKLPPAPVGKLGAPREQVSPLEMRKYMRLVRAVSEPTSILDDLVEDKLTPDTVDAVKRVYPEMFVEMQTKLMEHLVGLEAQGKKLKYRKRVQLGMMFDLPTDPTLDPMLMKAVAAHYAASPASSPGAGGAARGRASGLAAAMRAGSEENPNDSD